MRMLNFREKLHKIAPWTVTGIAGILRKVLLQIQPLIDCWFNVAGFYMLMTGCLLSQKLPGV